MKHSILFILAICLVGCTSLRPIDLEPTELQHHISIRKIIKVGDKVKITTSKNQVLEFEVTAIDDSIISGNEVKIPISQIISLEKEEIDTINTLLLVGTVIIIIYGVAVGSSLKYLKIAP